MEHPVLGILGGSIFIQQVGYKGQAAQFGDGQTSQFMIHHLNGHGTTHTTPWTTTVRQNTTGFGLVAGSTKMTHETTQRGWDTVIVFRRRHDVTIRFRNGILQLLDFRWKFLEKKRRRSQLALLLFGDVW